MNLRVSKKWHSVIAFMLSCLVSLDRVRVFTSDPISLWLLGPMWCTNCDPVLSNLTAVPTRSTHCSLFSPPRLRDGGLCFAVVLKILQWLLSDQLPQHTGPDLHEICRIGRTLAELNDRSYFFLSLKGRCRGNQFCGQNRRAILTF